MNVKKYESSKYQRILSVGILKYGAKIDGNMLFIYQLELWPIIIKIKDISDIYYGLTTTPVYVIKKSNGNTIGIPISFFDGKVFQQLMKDLNAINEHINFDERIIKFLGEDLSAKEPLKFDFEVHKFRLTLPKNPSLEISIGFLIVFFLLFLPPIFGFVGTSLLSSLKLGSVNILNVVLIVLSGFSFGIMLSNLALALVSSYFGHKVTTISGIVSVVMLILGFMQS